MALQKIHPPAFPRQPGHTRAAIYARVITSDNGQDPTMQTRELEEYRQRRGWELAGCYVDNGISGAKESRPELDRLMVDARQRKLDVVLVWKLDRFGRSLKHLVNALAEFEALGITVSRQNRVRLKIESDSFVRQCVDGVDFPLYVLNPCPSIPRLRVRNWRSLFLGFSINSGVGRATSDGLVARLS